MRWICDKCQSVKLGPERPRRNATIRVCLPCSAKSDTLIERRAPAREKEVAQRREKRAQKTQLQKDRAELKAWGQHTFAGIDVREVARDFWALPIIKAKRNGRPLPELVVRRSRSSRTSGRSWQWRVVMTISDNASTAQVYAIVFHELTHSALPRDVSHGDEFWLTNVQALREYFPDFDLEGVLTKHKNNFDRYTAIERAIAAHLEQVAIDTEATDKQIAATAQEST